MHVHVCVRKLHTHSMLREGTYTCSYNSTYILQLRGGLFNLSLSGSDYSATHLCIELSPCQYGTW